MSNSYRAFPKLMNDSKDLNPNEINSSTANAVGDNFMHFHLKMPEEVNQGGWDPAFDSDPSENSSLYKMNSMERCKVLNDRILQGALRKCTEMLDR